MIDQTNFHRRLDRRGFLKLAGGAALAGSAAFSLIGRSAGRAQAAGPPGPSAATPPPVSVHLAATDGWIALPGTPKPFFPDPYAPAPRTTYIFGFRDVTGLSETDVKAQKGKAQICAPTLAFDELADITITVRNLGLQQRPDLTDSHTIHWHGFRNAIPLFDGVPEMSVAAPIGRDLPYFYRPRNAGTYMYHCHFEDVEHVQMGMTGIVFVRPAQNQGAGSLPAGKYVYNDGDGSTAYDREFTLLLTEMWLESHYRDAHIQENDWTDYHADAWLLNGRSYPDTLAPNGDPLSPSGDPRLQYQPISSLVRANSGDKVLLRFANLGYQQHSMTLAGLRMRVVGKDATLLRGRDGTDLSYLTNTISIGPGESFDCIFTAPSVSSPRTYLLYDRDYANDDSGGSPGYGGQTTEVRIFPAGTLPAQTKPNE